MILNWSFAKLYLEMKFIPSSYGSDIDEFLVRAIELNSKHQLRHTIQTLNLSRSVPYTRRGTKAGRRVIRQIPRIVSRDYN